MKKTIIFLLMLVVGISVFCQQVPVTDLKIQKEQYLHKSKVQKTWAWITVGAGAAIIVASAIQKKSPNNDGWLSLDGLDRTVRTMGYVTGGVLMTVSIPLFAAAAKNKATASRLGVFIRTEPLPEFSQAGVAVRIIPAAGLRMLLK